jgi:hypothetical protein
MIILTFCWIVTKAIGQDSHDPLFPEPTDVDTATVDAKPVGGYNQLLRFLEQTISGGDTVGKKNPIPLYAIRFRINDRGGVDTAYVSIAHAACSIHRMIAKELVRTKWLPAKDHGNPVPYEGNLYERIQVTKAVQKRLQCRWR